jgi:genome maintenance exonuclease 1
MFTHVDHGIVLPTLTRQTTESGRKYFTPDGNAYPSITTVLSILGKEEIIAWRKRVGEEEANKVSRQASTRGTAVHKLAEDYVDNKPDWKGKHMPSNIATFNTLRPVLDARLNNIWMQEVFLYSDRLKTAGQVDCIGEWDGVLSIIDFKTSKRVKKEEDITNYFIQMCFYAAAFLERTGIAIKQAVVVMAVDDNEPLIFRVNTFDYLDHFISVRKKYKEMYEIAK